MTGLFAVLVFTILLFTIRISISIIVYFLHLGFHCLIRNILQIHAARHSHAEGQVHLRHIEIVLGPPRFGCDFSDVMEISTNFHCLLYGWYFRAVWQGVCAFFTIVLVNTSLFDIIVSSFLEEYAGNGCVHGGVDVKCLFGFDMYQFIEIINDLACVIHSNYTLILVEAVSH